MKIKIITVGQRLQDYTPQGKNYTIRAINATIQLPDGSNVQGVIKTSSEKLFNLIAVNAEFEADRQERQDQQTGQVWVSYFLDTKKNESLLGGKKQWNNNYSKPRISKQDYFKFAKECYAFSKTLDFANPEKYYGFILGSGVNTVDFEKKQDQPGNSQNGQQSTGQENVQKVNETFNKEKLNGTYNNEDIPF